jgi:putative restriction endonuclease
MTSLGQGSFRFADEQAYQQCAVTKEHSIPALEAAHIKPYSLRGFHEVNNGLLLRADIHKLECTLQK